MAPTFCRRATVLAMLAFLLATGRPKPADSATRNFALRAERKRVDIGSGMTYEAWTYDGVVPGPLLRVKEGDEVEISLSNHTTDAHGLYTHAAQLDSRKFAGPPGTKALRYKFRAEVPGVFDYHCTAVPMLDHVASGMYGMMIVDPKDGWPNGAAHEVLLIQGEFYGVADETGFIRGEHAKMVAGTPDFVVFNGKAEQYGASHPIPIKAGELVRVFFVNIGPNLSSAFHVVGALFSTVYRNGNPTEPLYNVQTFEVAPGDAAVLEFRAREPGDYPFLDHAMGHAYRGAMGIFRATP
jgi:nitrite reductase (NO-forming)